MRLNSKGQVTIPAALRHEFGFTEGDDVEVIADGDTLRIVHAAPTSSRGERIVSRMRGKATTSHTTDELMKLLRDERDD
ncbi:AbrB/MazE/SpoVT family DNA-binding domain-containing protein [Corynebacterium glyciniphilum]|uniref:SpoVT-AbrB domain-containing protein n=1 Tax=Corynebacterium glyciniphilum AJ 3170 TaxID=1404245 RepID=X5DQ25_9CORY|nr:AbrB/MazE/SpoVT family DNA-binding domain-containing protein [Corynebacterium glyciniphilum]AHW65293.1 Hypothetical protein CGLY_14275 [Corynebacterium glyciniphilum AJ 3170]